MTAILLPEGRQSYEDANGNPLVGGKLYTYEAGTATPKLTWSDADQIGANANPVILDGRGEATIFWSGVYKVILKDALDNTIWTVDKVQSGSSTLDNYAIDTGVVNAYVANNAIATGSLFAGLRLALKIANTNTGASTLNYMGLGVQAIIANGFALFGREMIGGVIYILEYDGTNWQLLNPLPYEPGDIRQYGIFPNDAAKATANTTIIQALLNENTSSFKGTLKFTNTTGNDIYYFNDMIFVKPGVSIDLCWSKLNFNKARVVGDNFNGWLTAYQDFELFNGYINVNYNGTGGTNAGPALRLGSRSSYPTTKFPLGIFDQTDLLDAGLPYQGNMKVKNLSITSNNPATHIVLMTGGLRDVQFDNVTIDGSSLIPFCGIYYEFGWATKNGGANPVALWTSSHATNMNFNNIQVKNLLAGTAAGIQLTGAYQCKIDGLYVNGADNAFNFAVGEALFYRTWVAQDDKGAKRGMTVRNVTGESLNGVGMSLVGASLAGAGYLAATIAALPAIQQYQAQTELMNFDIQDCVLATGTGLLCSGPLIAKNITILGGSGSGGIILTDECVQFDISNCKILDCSNQGIRAGFGTAIYSPARMKNGRIWNNVINGNLVAIGLNTCNSVIVENNRLGYSVAYDGVAEAVQTLGLSLGVNCQGVKCRSNYTTGSAGAAYNTLTNTFDSFNEISDERNTQATSGSGFWLTDFQSAAAQAIVAASTITISGLKYIRVTAVAACAGVILPAGYRQGQEITIIHESAAANTITFAVAGTSRVADGVTSIIAGLTAKKFVYDSGTSLWYRVA